jgi:predicted pyridoxine 5'-phosphate oxidase superfamily flavin-nucleotide-binding protein
MFGSGIPTGFDQFIREQRIFVIGASNAGKIWATVLTGPAGFAHAIGEQTIVINALPVPGDPLQDAFETQNRIGGLVLDPRTHRRIRANGRAHRDGDRLVIRTEQVLGNCPKYLQTRTIVEDAETDNPGSSAHPAANELSEAQRKTIVRADTFFIASDSPEHGADASHRGGQPGFISTPDHNTIIWPDYVGNSFYMTLGNLERNPRCGVTFLDWRNGHMLQLIGTARINWDPSKRNSKPGAARMVEFYIEQVVHVDNASSLRWKLRNYSRFNPPVDNWRGGRDQR